MRVWIDLKSLEHAESLKKSMCNTENSSKIVTENSGLLQMKKSANRGFLTLVSFAVE